MLLRFVSVRTEASCCRLSIRNPLAVVVNALTMAVGNINDAPLELNALAIKDMRLTMPELQGRIMYHYRQDVLRQVYRILGSADFIGNPVGLFTNVSSGVADIFYEPFNGVVMHGNKELGIGIAKVFGNLWGIEQF
jgi:vacuolar protein sorting-associated protein 13A/C